MDENIDSLIEEYVQKCNAAIEINRNENAKSIWYEVSGIFGAQIPGYYDFLSGRVNEESCLGDLSRIVGKLRVYGAKLEHETMIARLLPPVTTMNQITSIDINATFHQTINLILDNENLSGEDIKETLSKIVELKGIANSKEDGLKKWYTVKPILEWTIAKGEEIAPVIIPLVAAAIK